MIETQSDRIFEAQVPAEWIYRKIDLDYGLDREIEIVDDEDVTGKKILVQLKGSQSFELTDKVIKFPLETEKLEYYSKSDLPVLLVLVDLKTETSYWLFVHEYIEKLSAEKPSWRQQETVTLEIPIVNTWHDSIDKIRNIAFNAPSVISFKKLVASPDLTNRLIGISVMDQERFKEVLRGFSFATVYDHSMMSRVEAQRQGVEAGYVVSANVWPSGQVISGVLGTPLLKTKAIETVLTGSIHDLTFVISTTHPFSDIISQLGMSSNILQFLGVSCKIESYDTILLYLPPGFTMRTMDGSGVVTTDRNANVQVFRTSPLDIFAPGWTVVCVTVDRSGSSNSDARSSGDKLHTFDKDYYIRIRQVTTPTISGKYFFKIALTNRANVTSIPSGNKIDSTELGIESREFLSSKHWPELIVSGELHPAFITGTICYGDQASSTLRGKPLEEAGRVYAHMETKIDPYTGQQITMCPAFGQPTVPGCTDSVGYFSASSKGRYEMVGVAPGVYTIYAQAAGFPTMIIASGVEVMRGASLQFDGRLQPGSVIHGTIFSKDHSGNASWTESSSVKIELYDGPTHDLTFDHSWKAHKVSYDHLWPEGSKIESPGGFTFDYVSMANLVSWSPLPLDAGGQGIHSRIRSSQDVGPPQNWLVEGGSSRPFRFEFGVKGEYGAPRDRDGMVPQLYATWVNGLTPGRYYARAWVSHYTQSNADGVFLEYYFGVKPQEWAGEISLKIELRRER